MVSLELDPNPYAKGSPSNEEDLRFEDTVRHGHHVTLVRDTAGNIVYPTYIPQEILSPTSQVSADKAEPVQDERPRKSQTDPASPEKGRIAASKDKSTDKDRPAMEKKWMTEGPRRAHTGRKTSTFPLRAVPKRAGTSYLDKAIWQGHEDESTSSSSSSDDDDLEAEAEAARVREGQRQRRKRDLEDRYGRFHVKNENYKTKGKVKRDGRLRITVNETDHTGYLAKALGAAVKKVVPLQAGDENAEGIRPPVGTRLSSATTDTPDGAPRPRLNIVIMVIGSRGDAQPFLKIGKVLKEEHGHRVRIATHPAFRDFIEKDSGLEFFSVGGDPSELMAFMVKNPGMIPSLETVRAGDIGRRRAAMAEMFEGFWRACINATDDEKDTQNLKMMGKKDPFIADAIIANPPSFAHIHCAEALGIPLHLMFTFPYTPTQAFPHPLASVKKSNVDPGYTNFISYPLVEMMVWQGLGDLVNDFRIKTLGLDPVSTLWAPGATYRLHVPFTYLWSPGLVAKPEDWGDEVDVSGFVFLDLASSFKPPKELDAFLNHEEQPVYIGFGSIVVDDADKFTHMIFEAVKLAGVRALVSKGWGGLGDDNTPDNIYMLENTPHDWLFPKVRACVIHGGAGTTAIALKCGKPTMIVPFFGDQHFWGSMVGSTGAGPEPVPYKHLTAEKLAEGIKYCLTNEAQEAVGKIAKSIELEGDGAKNAVQSFHHHLNLKGRHSMRCSILADHVASWRLKNTELKLCSAAAEIIVEKGEVPWRKLRLLRHVEWNDFEGPGEPVTGVAGSLVGTASDVFSGIGSIPYRLARTSHRRHEKKERKRKAREQARHGTTQNSSTANGSATKESQKTATADFAKKGDKKDKSVDNKENQQSGGSSETQDERDAGGLDTASIRTATTAAGAEEYVDEVTTGVGKTAAAIARAPVDLSLALAQGFHNAPRLYGDDTVRRPPRVTGIRSGLKAARFEFVYGIYDGWTGLVRLPVRGAKKDGVKGLVKGTGMGVTGFILKDLAAIAGPVGYTLKGIAKQIERGRQPVKSIRRARIVQGQRELQNLGDDDRKAVQDEVVKGWRVMKDLLEGLEAMEKKKGLRGYLSAKKKRGLNAAFESVEMAEKALGAVNKGEPISSVVGTEKELRKSEDRRRKSMEQWKSQDKQDGKRQSMEQSRDDEGKVRQKEGPGKRERERNGRSKEGDIPEEAADVPNSEERQPGNAEILKSES
jgi:UDP:flavonoid glycosyltransferase YjiC (YdhE family)